MAFGLRVTAALLLVVAVYSFSLTRLTRKGRATSILNVEQKVRDYSISGAYPRPLIGDEEPKEATQSDQTSPVEDEVLRREGLLEDPTRHMASPHPRAGPREVSSGAVFVDPIGI